MRWFAWIAGLGLIVATRLAAGDEPLDGGNPTSDAAALVERLGDDSFEVRRRADELLRDLGLKARPELTAGLSHEAPEVRRRCRWILENVLQADFAARLDAFAADAKGEHDHDLPGWRRFREEIGDDAAAREFYVQLLRRESGLLISADSSKVAAEQSALLRLRQVYQQMTRRDHKQRKSPSMETVAALLFVVTDPNGKLPDELSDNAYLSSVVQQADFQKALGSGKFKPVCRKLLGRWILCPTGPRLIYNKLRLATQHRIPQGVPLALAALEKGKAFGGHVRAYAMAAVGQIGGKPYAGVLAEFLDDETECYRRTVNGESQVTEARDIALAWLVHLTGQSLEDYGMEQATKAFERLKKSPQSSISLHYLGFPDEEAREKALKRWDEWVKKHSLPEVPEENSGESKSVDILAAAAPPPADTEPEAPRHGAVLTADRLQQRRLEEARELIRQRRYSEAVDRLGRLLLARDNYTIRPDPKVPVLQCLKPQAERLLGELPPEGLDAYQTQFGAKARQEFDKAMAEGRTGSLERLAERYFFTRAGAHATMLLALGNLDLGHWQRAALYLARLRDRSPWAGEFEPALSISLASCLLRVGDPPQARDVLEQLAGTMPGGTVDVAGQTHELFQGGDDPLDWLESLIGPIPIREEQPSWLVHRGGPGRNVSAPAGGPYPAADRLAGLSDGLLVKLVERLRREQIEEHRPRLPMLHPLVVGGVVVVRTPTHLRAVTTDGGDLAWESPLEDSLHSYLRKAQLDGELEEAAAEQFADGLRRRLWKDATFGRLSSDGRRVFGVEGLSFQFCPEFQRLVVMPDGTRRLDPEGLKQHNLLAAYDVATGKLLWEVGGPADATEAREAGMFFLGPPLPLGDRLYGIARLESDTRLVELDARTGRLLWDLVLPAQDAPDAKNVRGQWPRGAAPEDESRLAGMSPSFADGILVCPTADDHLVAVDLATRSVLWLYQHFDSAPETSNLWRARVGHLPEPEPTEHWADNSITLADGRVLYTPLGSGELICLDLVDGQHQWSIDRRDGLYVGGVHNGRVVVVGHSSVWAVRLADGESAWADGPVALPPGALPAGRGYLTGERYHLPLTTAEVAAVDLARGRLVSRARSAEEIPPGNLVRAGDAVYSQTIEGLWRFDLLPAREAELADALREKPGDPAALADYGEVLLYQGRLDEAIDQLRRAADRKPTDRVRALMLEALVEMLRVDFARFEPLKNEFDSLLEESNQKPRLLRHLAESLQAKGRRLEAFETYRELVDLPSGKQPPEHFGAAWMVRRDRWISGRLAELWDDASDEDRRVIAEQVAAELGESPTADRLVYFDALPPAGAARLPLAAELAEKKQWLAAEQQMRLVLRRRNAERQHEAVARLAALMRARKRRDDAAVFYRELAGPLADAVCLKGKTGRQLVEALPADDPVRRLLEKAERWPSDKVEKEIEKKSGQIVSHYPLGVQAPSERFEAESDVEYDTRERKLIGRDPLGRQLWEVGLGDPPRYVNHNTLYYGTPARRIGHLLVAHLGDRVCAVDTLAEGGKLLWMQKTASSDAQAQIRLRMIGAFGAAPNPGAMPGSMPMMVAVSPSCVAFQRDRELLGVDPISGETLWSRGDLPMGCDLFGDGQRLLVTAPGAADAVVVSMLDGRQIGRYRVPSLAKRLSTCGVRVLTFEGDANQTRLALEAPLADEVVWQQTFKPDAQPYLIAGDEVAVLEPTGKLAVVSLPDGRAVLESKVDAPEGLQSIVVLRSAENYVLIANRPAAAGGGRVTYNYPGHIPVHGRVYGLDRKSQELLWTADLEHQSMRLGQPAEVPVLTFFSRVRHKEGNTYKTHSEIVCLDKRTGKRLHEEKSANSRPNFYDVHADPEKDQVEIRTYTETIRFKFL